MKYTEGILSLVVLAALHLLHTQAALFRGKLRGPNVCFDYDIGRHCCRGFTQRNGLCVLTRPSASGYPSTSNSRLRFAEKPKDEKLVTHSNVDKQGRSNRIAYLGGRSEERIYFTNKDTTALPKIAVNKDDFYVAVDMEKVRGRLVQQHSETTTAEPRVTNKPKLRFQPSPKPYRPWDNKNDRLSAPYSQQATGKAGPSYLQALMAGEQTVVNRVEWEPFERPIESSREDGQAAFKRPDIVTWPLNHKRENSTSHSTSQATNDLENRKYFKSVPIEGDRPQQQVKQQPANDRNADNKLSKECPEGYSSAYSIEEGRLCYPTFALLESVDRAPSRGDSAFVCPPGHEPHSSVYGEACVPHGWSPCSGYVGCSNDQQEPIVNPLVVSADCQTEYDGQSLPCRNSAPVQGCGDSSCADCESDDCGQNVVFGPENCYGTDCNNQPSGCDTIGCSDNIDGGSIDCGQGGCAEVSDCDGRHCDGTSAASGRCLNGGTKLDDGYCLCGHGFVGSQCEQRVTISEQDDVDECMEAGTDGRGPCSHQCLNTFGSYKCLCPAGAIVAQDGVSCIFITCPKCMHGGHCDTETNQCVCPLGFTGDICENDVNECEEVPGICSQECRNTFGSYACLCRPGYTLLRDGHTCEDWRCKPNCVNGGKCVRNKCICPSGFSGIICQFNNWL